METLGVGIIQFGRLNPFCASFMKILWLRVCILKPQNYVDFRAWTSKKIYWWRFSNMKLIITCKSHKNQFLRLSDSNTLHELGCVCECNNENCDRQLLNKCNLQGFMRLNFTTPKIIKKLLMLTSHKTSWGMLIYWEGVHMFNLDVCMA
jgi:hypothetical protein